jgi:hypothetical protein
VPLSVTPCLSVCGTCAPRAGEYKVAEYTPGEYRTAEYDVADYKSIYDK